MHDYFRQLNIISNISDSLNKKIQQSTEDQWILKLEQNNLVLSLDDMAPDPKIVKLINDIGDPTRLTILRFFNRECYNWHVDANRSATLNMLLTGFDSMCIFGKHVKNRRLDKIARLQYEPNRYYVMDVLQMHSVFNFGDDMRYILSIGIAQNGLAKTYQDVCAYLEENNLL